LLISPNVLRAEAVAAMKVQFFRQVGENLEEKLSRQDKMPQLTLHAVTASSLNINN
jgi:hypothetical protein